MEDDNFNPELNGTFDNLQDNNPNPNPSTVMDDQSPGTENNLNSIEFAGDNKDFMAGEVMYDDYDYDYDYNNYGGDGDGDAYFRNLPPGFRFRPTDAELTKFYLEKKLLNRELPRHRIFDVNIYEHHPETLCGTYERIRENGWYFFTSRNKKYPNGSRPDRAAKGGFWKPTGSAVSVPSKDNELWIRKSLDFYAGKHDSPKKSEWKMHEFTIGEKNVIHNNKRTADATQKLDEFVLCRIYVNRVANKNNNDEGETNGSSCDKPASAVSNSESSSDHNNSFSTWYGNNTSYIENLARYQAHPMNNNQSSSFTLVVDEDNMKISDHSYNLLPFNSAAGTSHHDFVLQQESGKQVWHGNNTSYIGNPARDRAHPMNNDQNSCFTLVVDEDKLKIPEHSYNQLPFNSAAGTSRHDFVPKQQSGKQVWDGNNTSYIGNPAGDRTHPMNNDQNSCFTLVVDEGKLKIPDHSYNLLPLNNTSYTENPAWDRAHPMNNGQYMILSSVHPDHMMNQLAQPSMVSQDFTDDYYLNADFLRDTFLADYLPQVDEEDDEEMWLDNNRPK